MKSGAHILRREHQWPRTAHGGEGEQVFPDLSTDIAARALAEHVERYLVLARRRRKDPASVPVAPEDLYFVDADENGLREIIGFRLRGHPLAMLGVVKFPRHENAPTVYGRPSLAYFFSKPPAQMRSGEATPPQGVIEIYLPRVGETIPELVERCRAQPDGRGVQVDVSLIDYAFDLRFSNPSAVPRKGVQIDSPQRRLFRTIYGDVLSGVSVGFYKTLRKDLQFITLTDAVQHGPRAEHVLPTMAFNRRIMAVEIIAGAGVDSDGAQTLAFHPSTANPWHIFGWAYEEVSGLGG